MAHPDGTKDIATSQLQPVERFIAPVREQVISMVRHAILSGEWRSGERLMERDICERTGASRSSVREALRQLEAEGLVTMVPNKGPVVTAISPKEAADIFELRAVFQRFAMARFCEHAGEEHMKALASCFSAIEDAVAQDSAEAAVNANTAFYEAVLDGAGNDTLTMSISHLRGLVALLSRTSMSVPGRMPVHLEEIRRIYRALVARNGRGAEVASDEHLQSALLTVINAIADQDRSAK